MDKTPLPTIHSTPSFHACDICLLSSNEVGTYHSRKIEVDRCELCKQGTAYSQPRTCSFPSHGGQCIDKRDMLANIARISGRDVPQTASLPSIAACGSYAEAHQACKMILVAVFSNLVKKRHWRYSASTKDLEGYICGRPEEYEKGCVKVESRGLFQYSYHKTSVDGLSQLHQTAVQAATSDPSTYICGLHDAAEVPGDTLVVVTPTLHQPYDFLFGRSFKSLIGVDMIRSLALDFFLFCAFLGPLSAQNTYFTTPPPAGAELSFDSDPVYAVNSQVQLGWVTNVGSYSIWLWQQAGGQLDSATCGSQIYSKSILRRSPC